jgi:hypothetical protein
VRACLRSTLCASLSPARSDCAVGAQPSKRKEQRKLNGAGTADADQPPAKRQRTEEEEREWVSRQGGRGSRNREWFDEERKKGQRVVIDLSFDDIMTEREVKSLVTQVCVATHGAHRVRAGCLRAELEAPGGHWQEQRRTTQKALPAASNRRVLPTPHSTRKDPWRRACLPHSAACLTRIFGRPAGCALVWLQQEVAETPEPSPHQVSSPPALPASMSVCARTRASELVFCWRADVAGGEETW